MAWNYRVMRHSAGEAANDEPFYAVHEVYYDKDKRVNGWTQELVGCSGETLGELSGDIAWYMTALVKPVLDFATGKEVEQAHLLEDDLYAMLDSPGAEKMRNMVRGRGAEVVAIASAKNAEPSQFEAAQGASATAPAILPAGADKDTTNV